MKPAAAHGPLGKIVLERAHFEAVCRGEFSAIDREEPRPKVKRVTNG